MNLYEVIREPLLSEKTYKGIAQNIYAFVVDRKSNKTKVKQAVEEIYKTQVERVNILIRIIERKPFRMSSRRGVNSSKKTSKIKIAFVKLKDNNKINLLEDPFKEKITKKQLKK